MSSGRRDLCAAASMYVRQEASVAEGTLVQKADNPLTHITTAADTPPFRHVDVGWRRDSPHVDVSNSTSWSDGTRRVLHGFFWSRNTKIEKKKSTKTTMKISEKIQILRLRRLPVEIGFTLRALSSRGRGKGECVTLLIEGWR